MRPFRLEIQGFTCYREKQEIDFSRLSLFAIAGPTGAGKSSILDAIVFALYGKIPRMGGQNLDEFISLGAARASVLFEFDLQNERFRVARSMFRSGPKRVQLEQISNGSQRALADGVGEVNAKLQLLLGLDYEAFIQSVLLPQGDFSKFLKSKPSEQRQILRDLLRLRIYERMRERASSEARDLAVTIAHDCKLLDGLYADATAENVAHLEKELVELTEKQELAIKQRNKLQRSLEIMRARWNLIQERLSRQTILHGLNEVQPKMNSLKKTIERAKRAALVVPLVEQSSAKFDVWTSLEKEVQALESTLESARQSLSDLQQKLHGAEKRMGVLPQKRQREGILIGLQPILKERKSLAIRYDVARRELVTSEQGATQAKAALERAQKAVNEAKKGRELVGKYMADLGFDETVHALFKSAIRRAFDLSEARKQAAFDPKTIESAVQSAEAALREAEKEFGAAKMELAAAEKKSKAAQSAYEAAQDQHKAAALRSVLVPGCACPVCEQPVHKIPVASLPADLAKAKSAVTAAKSVCDKAAERTGTTRDTFNRALVTAENARNHAADLKAQAGRAWKQVEEYAQQLTKAIRPFDCPAGILIEQFVEQELARLEKLHTDWQDLGGKLSQAELASQRAESTLEAAERALETEEKTKLRLTGVVADAERRLAEYDTQISVVSSDDPEQELKSIQKEVAEIEKQYKDAAEGHRQAEAAAHQKELKATDAKARLTSAATERDNARATAEKALHDARFVDSADARQASIEPKAIAAHEEELEHFEQRVTQTQSRIRELDTELNGVSLTEADVNHENDKTTAADNAVNHFGHQLGQRTERFQKLKDDTEKAEALRFEHEKRRLRHALVQQLSQDLRSDCFQQYLLEGSFHRLVAGASGRLRELNDRYELAFSDGKFAVIDHDHGSLTRLADTLSGGETFLVSLALALELSEQVQQAAGAVRLDSLFIDEASALSTRKLSKLWLMPSKA